MGVHRLSDEIARWATSTPGAAASRLLFVSGGRVYRIDSDGAEIDAGDARRSDRALAGLVARTRSASRTPGSENGRGSVVLQALAGGASQNVGGGGNSLNITPVFSPDGRTLAYAHSDETGTDISQHERARKTAACNA